MSDEPLVIHPIVRALEQEAINLYRAAHPQGPLWQELQSSTRHLWVEHAEKHRAAGVRGTYKDVTAEGSDA